MEADGFVGGPLGLLPRIASLHSWRLGFHSFALAIPCFCLPPPVFFMLQFVESSILFLFDSPVFREGCPGQCGNLHDASPHDFCEFELGGSRIYYVFFNNIKEKETSLMLEGGG